jgi:hypothetical protein
MKDYSWYYKDEIRAENLSGCDVFLSAYTASERVQHVFDKAVARRKQWIVFPEYGYTQSESPAGAVILNTSDEAEDGLGYLDTYLASGVGENVCIDITGFPRAHLVFLLRWLVLKQIQKIRLIYSEPDLYADREKTAFAKGNVTEVRQIRGCEGVHSSDTRHDVLVIASGYDHELISYAAESKNNAVKIQFLGMPALRPEMYQENVLRANRAANAIGGAIGVHPHNYFAPANDPFVMASELSRIVSSFHARKPITNLYLCPLSTKPQVVGMTLFFLWERMNSATSIIFPFSSGYSRETSKGYSRSWQYTVELPAG